MSGHVAACFAEDRQGRLVKVCGWDEHPETPGSMDQYEVIFTFVAKVQAADKWSAMEIASTKCLDYNHDDAHCSISGVERLDDKAERINT